MLEATCQRGVHCNSLSQRMISIRRIEPTDVPAVLALAQDAEVRRFLHLDSTPSTPQLTASAVSKRVELECAGRGPGRTWVILDATEQTVGLLHVGCGREAYPEMAAAVDGTRRGQGIAEAAARELMRTLSKEGQKFVDAIVDIENVPAQRLVEKLGFVPNGDNIIDLPDFRRGEMFYRKPL